MKLLDNIMIKPVVRSCYSDMHTIRLRLTKVIHSRSLNVQIMKDFSTKVATNKLSSFEAENVENFLHKFLY